VGVCGCVWVCVGVCGCVCMGGRGTALVLVRSHLGQDSDLSLSLSLSLSQSLSQAASLSVCVRVYKKQYTKQYTKKNSPGLSAESQPRGGRGRM